MEAINKPWACPEQNCEAAFVTDRELEAHRASVHRKPVVVSAQLKQEPPKRVATPITLKYEYKGNCSSCGGQASTIELNMDKPTKLVVVAYCLTCKRQLESREVNKL